MARNWLFVICLAALLAGAFVACGDDSTGGWNSGSDGGGSFPLAGTSWRGVHNTAMQITFTSASAYTRTEGFGSINGTYSVSGSSITLTDQGGGSGIRTGTVWYDALPAPTMTIVSLGVFSKL